MKPTSTSFILIVVFGVFLLATIVITRAIEYFLGASSYRLFYHIIAVAILINVFIFLFLIFTFKPVKLAPGPPGPKGNRGGQGYSGATDSCGMCGVQKTTLGYQRHAKELRELIIVENPILATRR